jgi:hypothetical protein
LKLIEQYDFSTINLKAFEEYSAKSVTAKLAGLLDQAATK